MIRSRPVENCISVAGYNNSAWYWLLYHFVVSIVFRQVTFEVTFRGGGRDRLLPGFANNRDILSLLSDGHNFRGGGWGGEVISFSESRYFWGRGVATFGEELLFFGLHVLLLSSLRFEVNRPFSLACFVAPLQTM